MSRPPLVLAIEPDLRQAAIVKRIVRERVQADVTVVDSRDAAIEAIRATMPDVLLVSALLSPRDEDDLIAHLRMLDGASHLQTHTIPQLASTFGDDDKESRGGLLSAFRRKKPSGAALTGCDPDLFADEIRAYLQRAAEKKREAAGRVSPVPRPATRTERPAARAAEETPTPVMGSSWESPFEWRPEGSAPRMAPAPPLEPPPRVAPIADPVPSISYAELVADPEPDVAYEPLIAEPKPSTPELVAKVIVPPPPAPPKVHRPAPLSVWARKEGPSGDVDVIPGDLRRLLSHLSVPDSIAAVSYASGVRIRRVRVPAQREGQKASGPMVLARRMLAELRGGG